MEVFRRICIPAAVNSGKLIVGSQDEYDKLTSGKEKVEAEE
jgi:ribosomal protein L30E